MIVALASLVLVFTVAQLIVVSVNLWCREELPVDGTGKPESVSVLIPARNEASRIGRLLSDLVALKDRPAEVIVCDDHSSDGTAEIVEWFSDRYSFVRCIRSSPLPEGWLGKNFACWQLARQATGKYLLFLDADVRIGNGCILRAVSFAEECSLDLLSVFPKQTFTGLGDRMVVPIMNYILLTLLPLIAVRKVEGYASLSAANGQFMLFREKEYRELQPHYEVRGSRAEDIAIAAYFKKMHRKVGCLTGDETIRCCMYSDFRGAVEGFSRNIRSFFGNSLLLAFLFWVTTTFGFVFVWLAFPWPVFAVYIFIFLLIRVFTMLVSRQGVTEGVVLCLFQQISCGCILFRSAFQKHIRWKGRIV